ncbi:restriction endonuclease subunit S [Glaesserella parasuis]|uniref:restriction endonuclease subunit S n=1 Tax=Glaesserella parasuis TaxID=738 RepID=UPI0013667D5A|nr:restriction endonuclease subunit S [Glaesserella parasuis]MDG6318828.1 restriction endonuclease subunit S [Glaesserella parasuis]MWQ72187.1 restriction endonuclease subunit S [Glaesserella parasuis]
MSSWKQVRFSEICDITRGGSPRPIQEYMTNDGVPWIKISDATASNSRFIEKTKEFIKTSGISKSREVFPDDLILSNSATPGIPKFMRIYACIHDGWLLLRNFNGAEKEFIYWLLLNERDKLIQQGNGSVFTNLKTDILKNHIVNIPDDIEEQKRIATILNNIQEKIELNTQINQTLEQIAQTIFKSWFIDFDPVHAKAEALANGQTAEQATQAAMAVISGKNTQELHRLQTANPEQYQQLWEIAEAFPSGFSGYKNLGEIPIGWNVLTFKDFISESKEKIGSLEDVPEYSVGNEGIYPRSEKYNKSLSKTPEKNKVVRIGDLVFGMGSKTLNWGIMNDEIGSVSPAYFVYRIFTNINYIYLNKYIKAKEYDFQNLIKPTSRQGQSVDKEMFLKKEIYVPNEYLLNIYLNKLKEIDSLVYSYTTEVLILEQIRDELLPKLLSGEI